MARVLRVGTRGSALALAQTGAVVDALRGGGREAEIVVLSTRGDRDAATSVARMPTVGVFTRELQEALLDGRVDVAVHSLKDLPTEGVAGLVIAATPEREEAADALVSRRGETLAALPLGATVGTGSLRRQAQMRHLRPDLQLQDLRGNVDTRLRALVEGRFDAVVVAAAGLARLGRVGEITEHLRPPRLLPAPGQGALALEARADDRLALDALARLDDPATRAAVTAERSVLAALAGGCLAPVGAWARIEADGRLALSACVVQIDGSRRLDAEQCGPPNESFELGRAVAGALLAQGAAEIIERARLA